MDNFGQKFRFPVQSSIAAKGFNRLRLYQQSHHSPQCQTIITDFS